MESDAAHTPETIASASTPPGAVSSNAAPAPIVALGLSAQGADDEERQALLAALKASRELGPEMDSALADHYFEQRARARSRALRRQQRTPRTFGQRARQAVQRLREAGWLGPVLIGSMILLGMVGLSAITLFAALHGLPHGLPHGHYGPPGPGFQHTDAAPGGANGQNGQQGNRPNPDGFFPFFGLFPWVIPIVVLLLMRQRALARGNQRYQGQLSQGQGNGPALPSDYQAPSAEGVMSAPPTQPTSAATPPHDTGYRPYDPFGASTPSPVSTGTTSALPSDGASTGARPASGVTNEVSPPPTTKPLSNPAG
jgi:hypothetical protein